MLSKRHRTQHRAQGQETRRQGVRRKRKGEGENGVTGRRVKGRKILNDERGYFSVRHCYYYWIWAVVV